MSSEVEALLSLVSDSDAGLQTRLNAGKRLAELGDPRALGDQRAMIPTGTFLMGDPPRTVLMSDYAIDRYPVTVSQYARFIESGGYQQQRYWSRAGWAFRTRAKLTKPRFWGEVEWAPYLIPNHPVVGVSAYEAEAYAAFVGAALPTEAQWEKAARGTDGRRFPWGSEWVEDAAGKRDYGPRCTVPIGSYPKGVSPYGVYDMSGCVWQWCRDAVDADAERDDEDPFLDPDDYEEGTERATRGGGWNNLDWNLTTTSCNAYPPTAQFSNLGFRCVWEPG
jgi:formylglycine-generating enzyme required for sulfatase activity